MARLTRHGVVSEADRTPEEVDAAERAITPGRKRPLVHLSLSPEAIARLDAIAAQRGQTRSGAVEQLIRNARLTDK
jgi:hypothetical protein